MTGDPSGTPSRNASSLVPPAGEGSIRHPGLPQDTLHQKPG